MWRRVAERQGAQLLPAPEIISAITAEHKAFYFKDAPCLLHSTHLYSAQKNEVNVVLPSCVLEQQ